MIIHVNINTTFVFSFIFIHSLQTVTYIEHDATADKV